MGGQAPESGEVLPFADAVAASIAVGPDDVLSVGRPPQPHPRLARFTGLIPRRIAAGVGGLGLAALVAFQVTHPDTGPPPALPASPLLSAACASGSCRADFAQPAELEQVSRTLDSNYTVSGLRTRDPHEVLRQIQVVASDGVRVLTIRGAENAHAPASWAAPLTRTRRANFEWTVTRSVLTSPASHTKWLVEVRTAGPVGSESLLAAATRLSADRTLVD